MLQTACIVIVAVIMDRLLGEPERWHPLVCFGRCVNAIERKCWRPAMGIVRGRWLGSLALFVVLLLALLIYSALTLLLALFPWATTVLSIVVVYACIGAQSLNEHALAVATPLAENHLKQARLKLSRIVSRDVDNASAQDIASATCESVLENGSDAIFAALFWFVVAGLPGIVIYRAVNTVDAMWGYRNERYQHFGWAAAKLDDIANYIPARLVAFSYALMGHFNAAMRCWSEQANQWKSPNAGPVMAAGAGSLRIRLGGKACYHGHVQPRPTLGEGEPATVDDIRRALALIDRTVVLWLIVIVLLSGV